MLLRDPDLEYTVVGQGTRGGYIKRNAERFSEGISTQAAKVCSKPHRGSPARLQSLQSRKTAGSQICWKIFDRPAPFKRLSRQNLLKTYENHAHRDRDRQRPHRDVDSNHPLELVCDFGVERTKLALNDVLVRFPGDFLREAGDLVYDVCL